jgi:hypothetical protein
VLHAVRYLLEPPHPLLRHLGRGGVRGQAHCRAEGASQCGPVLLQEQRRMWRALQKTSTHQDVRVIADGEVDHSLLAEELRGGTGGSGLDDDGLCANTVCFESVRAKGRIGLKVAAGT